MSLTAIIDATAAAVADDASRAGVTFKATGSSTVISTTVRARQHRFLVDEPATLGGEDSAANPVEYALGALASCQAITYRFWAAKLGVTVDEISIEAEGDLDVRGFFGLDDSVRPGFSAIRVTVSLSGPESAQRYQELQEAVERHCPVLDLFANPTPVTAQLRINAPA
ncbi:MAG TPA: OsmC family protein [Kineosporiaceae bacterium]|nr:OsmC family protein [Kineosporiaceae bacterium]